MIFRISARWTRRKHKPDLEHYLAHLVKLNDSEMSLLAMIAALARNEMEKNALGLGFACGMSLLQPQDFVALAPFQVRHFEVMFRDASDSQKQVFVCGLTPWLHTIRAVENPNLTFMVKLMWQEIAKGFERVPDRLREFSVDLANVKGFSNIPDGFEC